MSLANFLKYYREEVMDITQKEAAGLLNIRAATLSHYEKGLRQVPLDTLRRIKDIYRIEDDVFMAAILNETADQKVIKESTDELSKKMMRTEDQEMIRFLREHPSLYQEIMTLSRMTSSKQKTHVKTLLQLFKILKTNYYS